MRARPNKRPVTVCLAINQGSKHIMRRAARLKRDLTDVRRLGHIWQSSFEDISAERFSPALRNKLKLQERP